MMYMILMELRLSKEDVVKSAEPERPKKSHVDVWIWEANFRIPFSDRVWVKILNFMFMDPCIII
jgi:hypothetical protein